MMFFGTMTEICKPSHSFDDELLKVHLAQSAHRFPGPDYYTVLRWIHEFLRPQTYVEIGVRAGDSLRLALPETRCIGIDPEPVLMNPVSTNTRVFQMASDEFFATRSLPEELHASDFELAFIDGLHLFEQALRDFIHLEKFSSPRSLIILHDCLPLDATTADRTRTTHFYSGDVWKLTLGLKLYRHDLRMKIIRTAPTGLCLVSNLNRESKALERGYSEFVSELGRLTFQDFERLYAELPASAGNNPDEVISCVCELLEHPAQSHRSPLTTDHQ